jgi:hypothetical protein
MHYINKKNNSYAITASLVATLLTFTIMAAVSNITTTATPAVATTSTTTSNGNTTTISSSEIELSPEPVFQEQQITIGQTPINQTHIQLTESGKGTLTLPNTTETINFTSTGSLLVSMDGTTAGKEVISTEDGSESATATFFGITRFNMEEGIGKGIVIALIHTNSTGRLAPLDGMILAGQVEFPPDQGSLLTLWEWQSGIPLPTTDTTSSITMEGSPSLSPMNTTTATTTANATTAASDTNNTTGTASEEQGGGEQQQCQLEIMPDGETFELGDSVTINVTNGGDEALEFPNSILGLEIENQDTGEAYPLFSAQVITTLEPGESTTFEFTYEEIVSEIGTGTIEASVSSGEECSASTTFI